MANRLPRECLEEIFHILEYEKSTLHSCLLVNRSWCISVIRFLWKRPFQLAKKPCSDIIEIYISFFSPIVKNYLLSEGVNIPLNDTTKIFDYPSFIRDFRFDDLYESTSAWLQEEYEKGRQIRHDLVMFDDLRIVKLIVNELVKLLFSKTRILESLSLNTQRLIGLIDRRFWSHHPGDIQYTPTSFEEFRSAYGFDDLLQIPNYPGANNCLVHLQKFEYGGDATDGKIMQVLSEVSQNLNTLEISFSSWQRRHADPQMMLSLLTAQHALHRVILRRGGSNCLPILIGGLSTQASSLNHLEFIGADFRISVSLTPLVICVNLQTLVFERCLGLNDDIVEPLAFATFKKLKKFVFRKSVGFRDLRTILAPPSVVPITGNHIQGNDIRLGRKVWNVRRPLGLISRGVGDFPPSSILSTLSITCPYLVKLETHTSREIFPQLLILLNNCQLLQQLHISVGTELMDDEQFWKRVSRAFPPKLKNLMVVIEGTFWLMVIHWLLGNCKAPLEVLQFPRSSCIDDEYLCLITQYAEVIGTLKKLILARRTRVSNEGLRRALIVFESVSRGGEVVIEYDN
ncbi:10965_t:CDS:2 [Rhizophagus irregularis]|nr:10965_t:CDS:2 [Rhizophagus irregularis]